MNYYNHQLITLGDNIRDESVIRFSNNLRNDLRLRKFSHISKFFHTKLNNLMDLDNIADEDNDEIIVLLALEQIPKFGKKLSELLKKYVKKSRIIIILDTKYIEYESNLKA